MWVNGLGCNTNMVAFYATFFTRDPFQGRCGWRTVQKSNLMWQQVFKEGGGFEEIAETLIFK